MVASRERLVDAAWVALLSIQLWVLLLVLQAADFGGRTVTEAELSRMAPETVLLLLGLSAALFAVVIWAAEPRG